MTGRSPELDLEAEGGAVYTDGQWVVVLAGDSTTVTYTVFPAP